MKDKDTKGSEEQESLQSKSSKTSSVNPHTKVPPITRKNAMKKQLKKQKSKPVLTETSDKDEEGSVSIDRELKPETNEPETSDINPSVKNNDKTEDEGIGNHLDENEIDPEFGDATDAELAAISQ